MRLPLSIFLASIMAVAPGLAMAQAITLPSSAEATRIGSDTLVPDAPPAQKPLAVQPQNTANMAGINPEQAKKYHFTLQAVHFKGNTVYTDADLKAFYAADIGQKVSLLDVVQMADRITAKYHKDGYVLSRALVPEQTIKNGIVTVRIVEGYIDKVSLQGPGTATNAELKAYARKIEALRPYNDKDGQRYILLANDLPGQQLRYLLTPSPTTPGATTMTLISLNQKNFGGIATLDNRGSRYLGPLQASIGVTAGNTLGENEQLTFQGIRVLDSNELSYGSINGSIPVGNEGTRLGGQVAIARTEPGFTLSPLDVVGRFTNVSLALTHPIVRSRDENLQGSIRFDIEETRNKSFDTKIADDSLRVLRAGANYQLADRDGYNQFGVLVSQGLDIFGARGDREVPVTRFGGNTSFTKLNATASRLQGVAPNLNLLMAAAGQLSSGPLLSAEQFGLGGPEFLRGYDNSDVVGDHGLAGKLEMQYNVAVNEPYFDYMQLYGLVDAGQVWFDSPTPATINNNDGDTFLASVGVGSRFRFTPFLTGFVELDQPIDYASPTNRHKDPRVYAGLSASF